METIKEYQSYESRIKEYNSLSLKSKLYLSKKNKIKNQKQYFIHLNSIHKTNTCEITSGSQINSISNLGLSFSTSTSSKKKLKGRVNFAPRYRFIDYIYYDPRETIRKEEKQNEIKEEVKKEEKIYDNLHKKEEEDKIVCNCICSIM